MPLAAGTFRATIALTRNRMAALLAVVVASIAGTAWLVDGVREAGDLASWDGPTHAWLVAHRGPFSTGALTAVTTVGGEIVFPIIAALTVLALALSRHRLEALLLAVALAAAEATSWILKHEVARARPPAVDVLGPVEHTLSFPSGHTIGTATFTLTLAYLWWRGRPSWARMWGGLGASATLTALMATSRLYLGDHWLTDVLASSILAFGVVAAVILLDLWLKPRLRDRAGERTP